MATARRTVLLPAGEVTPAVLDAVLRRPRLWQGLQDPYLYTSEVSISSQGAQPALLDRLGMEAGVRDLRLDPARGLLLNGQPYKVHGIKIHLSYVPGKGTAHAVSVIG